MISLANYYKGFDRIHADELTPELQANAERTVAAANALQARAVKAGVPLAPAQIDGKLLPSGWRPKAVNARTPRASKTSLHMSCEAIDLFDTPDQPLGRWLQTDAGRAALEETGLWMEDPNFTPTWVHVQTRPPPSGKRYFIPR